MPIHLTLLKPGPGHQCGADDVLVELSPGDSDSIESDRAFWKAAGEYPDIVIGHLTLEVPETAESFIDDVRAREGPEILESILTASFNLGRAFQG